MWRGDGSPRDGDVFCWGGRDISGGDDSARPLTAWVAGQHSLLLEVVCTVLAHLGAQVHKGFPPDGARPEELLVLVEPTARTRQPAEQLDLIVRGASGVVSTEVSLEALARTVHDIMEGRLTVESAVIGLAVENLQSRLYQKLGVRNRAQAIAVAHQAGLLSDDFVIDLAQGETFATAVDEVGSEIAPSDDSDRD